MAETQAASSPAEMQDPFNGGKPTVTEFSHYRSTGEVPERFKPQADPTPADSPEETVVEPESEELETAPESDPEEAQEQPPKGSAAERRIKQLLAQNKELQRKLEAAPKPTQADPSPAQAQPAPANRPKPTAEDKTTDGKPKYASYEDFVEDLADWKAEQSLARFRQQQAQEASQRELQSKIAEARQKYEDFDEVIEPTARVFNEDREIPDIIKRRIVRSGVSSDLLYVIGSDPDELAGFVKKAKSDTFAALDYIALTERAIREELAGEPNEPPAPAPKRTQAPKPPSPVSGGSSRAFDVSDESLSPEEWMRKRTSDLKRRGKA